METGQPQQRFSDGDEGEEEEEVGIEEEDGGKKEEEGTGAEQIDEREAGEQLKEHGRREGEWG